MIKSVSRFTFFLALLTCCSGEPIDEIYPEEPTTTPPPAPEEPRFLKTSLDEREINFGPFGISLIENTNRLKRAVSNTTKLWPHKIPYVINDTFKKQGLQHIVVLKRAMKYIMDRVCIEFVDVTDTYKPTEPNWFLNNGFQMNSYILITDNGGCNADIGPGTGARTNSPCHGFWINLHELGHSVGAMHTHESPNRDSYITVYTDNVKPHLKFAYKKSAKTTPVLSNYFDPKSILMYNSGTFSSNGLETYSVIIDDLFQTISGTSTDDALYSDLNQLYKCRETYCNDQSVDCSPGYYARIKGVCRCVCPEERDEGNNCKTLRNGPLAYAQWPKTPLVLLSGDPQHACPAGFTQGWFSFTGTYPISQGPSPPVKFPSSGNTNYIPVCTKDTPSGSDIDWESWHPVGRYCFIKPKVPCGGAFKQSQLEMLSREPININGSVGDTLIKEKNITQKYCCISEDPTDFLTELPNAVAFRLFTRDQCPKIRGMKLTRTRNNWWSKVYTITNKNSSPWWPYASCLTTFTCYYQPPVYGCNREITLDANTKTATFTTPGFPNAREPNRRCFYSVNVPEGSRIKITFNTVDLSTNNEDAFQYKRFHKWQDPYRLNPNNWPRDVVSEGDYFTAEFWSGFDTTTKKGVSFTVTLIEAKDMCYDVASNGADYTGNIKVSENYEECLPWSEAVDCADFPQSSSIWLLQSGNSCRNPRGELLRPYCYVHINGTMCRKRYCDVCSLRTVVDVIKNCSELMAADRDFCKSSFSKSGCARSCGYKPSPYKRKTCDAPTAPKDGAMVSPRKSTYNEGEIVQFNCTSSDSDILSEKMCTKSGWTSLTKACKGCSDRIDSCQDLLRSFPRFCSHINTIDVARRFCPRSCAVCPDTTTCSAPGMNKFNRTSDSETVEKGQIMTFSCNAGLYYWSGDRERACGTRGKLLGKDLDCRAKPPVTDVNMNLIRKRLDHLNTKIAYLLDNDEYKIPIKGVITRWYYYCGKPGVITFAVYRKSNITTRNVFEYVGANNVTCQPGYPMTYYVPAESQILVEAGDVLAVHSTDSKTLYVSNCKNSSNIQLTTQTIAANTFSELATKPVSGTFCLIPSYGSRVQPV